MKEKNMSRFLALILRHKPEAIGISLDEHGWANVSELIEKMNKQQKFNMAMLEEIVATDDKQRYSFSADKTRIRANQGHSIPVDVELPEKEPPEFLFHGTGQKYTQSINKSGLLSQSRLYVHLSADENTATAVGTRHGTLAMYRVKSGEMFSDGYKFFLSVNGVWLTKSVPPKYLERII